MRVGLVGCVKSKRSYAAPAKDLYTSPLFVGRRRCVEQTCDRWYILSALHGLVRPDDELAPYDRTLTEASTPQRRRWSENVIRQLEEEFVSLKGLAFDLHAGAAYARFGLEGGLRARGATVSTPTAGLPLGRQLAYYAGGCGG